MSESSVDREEVARFSRLAQRWWDENGEFRPLHRLNPTRLGFIRDKLVGHFARETKALAPFAGLRLLDIGCGGGLVAEPMARLGFAVTGIDADGAALEVARAHTAAGGLAVDYRQASAEDLVARGERFDAVLALEVVEHVADHHVFLAAAAKLVAPGGALILSTINRTPKALAFAVIGAEYVLRWLPRGTHRWEKFLRPSELAAALRPHGYAVAAVVGLNYAPWRGWTLGGDLQVNYFLFAIKAK